MTADATGDNARAYRFGPLDRGGWILGLGAAPCLSLAGGVVVAGTLLDRRAHPAIVITPLLVGAILAFGSWEGRAVHEWLPVALRHGARRASGGAGWRAPLPLLTGRASDQRTEPPLPPFLSGLSILDAGPATWAGSTPIGVVRDRRDRTISASVPVAGRAFSLGERAEQERLLQSWGDVLGGFCTERGPVGRVRVTEWAAPVGVGDHEEYLADHGHSRGTAQARADYEQLLASAGPGAVGHEVLVTITVELRRVKATRRAGRADDAAVDLLLEELRTLANRLDAAGLHAGPPLTPTATAVALRRRLDPATVRRLATRRASLAEATGLVSPWNAGPLATEIGWGSVRVDGSFHRTYWIAEWPRLDVGPAWLEPVLLHAGGVRTFALHYEPTPPSRSHRRIDRDSTRLAADEEQRNRGGFRIGARHRRAQAAVLEREAELVAGYHELEHAGFVTVSAHDEATLARSCAEYEQVAAQAGLELRALDGRHELGLVCALPLGRGLARRRFA